MNLRVDLILATELRSGSVVSSQGVLRIASVVVPFLLVGFLGWQFLAVRQLRQELESNKLSLDSAAPQQERAKALIAEFQTHRNVAAELAGWNKSRIAWHHQLFSLMGVVPENIQLNDLNISQSLQLTTAEKPARMFVLSLKGKAVGDDAEQSVKRLETALISNPAFESLTETVTVPLFGADTTPEAKRDDRVFEISCLYTQRAFE